MKWAGLALVAIGLVVVVLVSRAASAGGMQFRETVIDVRAAGDCKAVVDLNGDGLPDLVLGGRELCWYENPSWKKTVIATASNEFSTDMASGDVDRDGDQDLIVPDGTDGLFWFENPGRRGDPWIRHLIGNGQAEAFDHDVEVGDLDGDGDLDAVTRPKGGSAFVFRQDAPSVWVVRELHLGTLGEGLCLSDLDADGRLDIVVEGRCLLAPRQLMTGEWRASVFAERWTDKDAKVATGDLNGDGRLDVVLTPSEGAFEIAWFEAPADRAHGAWLRHEVKREARKVHSLAVADMDLDGDLDLVTAEMHTSPGSHPVSIFRNETGDGRGWRQEVVSGSGSHNLVVADVDRDGDVDLFGSNFLGNPPLRLWLNDLPLGKRFTYIEVTRAHEQTFGLAFGDMNRDGSVDIVSGAYWYENPGGNLAGVWRQHGPFPGGAHAMLAVDVDSDRFPDLIAQRTEGEQLRVYWLESTDDAGDSWSSVEIGRVPAASHSLGAQGYDTAQLDGRGRPEVVITSGDGIYYFTIPDAPSRAWQRRHVHSNPSDEGFAVGDVDADGDLDIAASTGESKRVEWYANPGDGSSPWPVFVVGRFDEAVYPDRCRVADLDGDGRLDIVVTEENGAARDAETFWWRQPADPTQSGWQRRLVVSQASTNSLGAADLDGDGDTDLILAEHAGSNKLGVWENDGAGHLREREIDRGKESHLGARVVDLDGDGDLDIVSIAYRAPRLIHLWRNNSVRPPSGRR